MIAMRWKDEVLGVATTENCSTMVQKPKRIFKIVVVGDSDVGKTCLAYRFCKGKKPDNTSCTIGVDFWDRVVNIEGEEIKLQIWDTAGQERFWAMNSQYFRDAHAVIIVYDVTRMSTFQSVVTRWLEECQKYNLTDQVPRILVGNKCDCVDSLSVETKFAQSIADLHNMQLYETSTQLDSQGSTIENMFKTLAQKIPVELFYGLFSSLSSSDVLYRLYQRPKLKVLIYQFVLMSVSSKDSS